MKINKYDYGLAVLFFIYIAFFHLLLKINIPLTLLISVVLIAFNRHGIKKHAEGVEFSIDALSGMWRKKK